MTHLRLLIHEFVEYIPEHLKEGTIYISIPFATAVHKCCCGCGREVVTPLSPIGWKLTFDGETISLDPSIGNWSFPCQSHYWIRQDRVQWAPKWSQKQVNDLRARESQIQDQYFHQAETLSTFRTNLGLIIKKGNEQFERFWHKMIKWRFNK